MFSPALPNVTLDVEEDNVIEFSDTWSGTPDADGINWDVSTTSNRVGLVLVGTELTITGLGSTDGESNDRVQVFIDDETNGDTYSFYVTVEGRVADVVNNELDYTRTNPVFLNMREHWVMTLNWETYFDPDAQSGFSLSAAVASIYSRTTPTGISNDVTYTFTGAGATGIRATAGGVTKGDTGAFILSGGGSNEADRLPLSTFDDDPIIVSPDMEVEIPLAHYDYELPALTTHDELDFSFRDSGDSNIATASLTNTTADQKLIVASGARWGYTELQIDVRDGDTAELIRTITVPVFSYSYYQWRPSSESRDLFGVVPEFITDTPADLTGIVETDLFSDGTYDELVRFEGYITRSRVIGNRVEIEIEDIANINSIPEEILGANTGGVFDLLKVTENSEVIVKWPNVEV